MPVLAEVAPIRNGPTPAGDVTAFLLRLSFAGQVHCIRPRLNDASRSGGERREELNVFTCTEAESQVQGTLELEVA